MRAPREAAAMLVEVAKQDMLNIERTVQGINEDLLMEAGVANRTGPLPGARGPRRFADHEPASGLPADRVGLCHRGGKPCGIRSPGGPAWTPGTCSLPSAFRPTPRETLDVVDYAPRRNTPVIAFTDALDSPWPAMRILRCPWPEKT